MKTADYQIGGKRIRVISIHEKVHRYCRDYAINESEEPQIPDLIVTIDQDDLEYEREQSVRMAIHEGIEITDWPDDYLEELAVYRKIAEWMPSQDTFLFHGSVIAVDDCAYLFTARSGTGKSTHTRLWRELLGNRAFMVNDDKPLIHISSESNAIAYGTPWNGKHRLGGNVAVPLKAICILERSKENWIKEITKKEAYPMLLQQVYRSTDPVILLQTAKLIDRMRVLFFRLGCNMELEAARLAYEIMSAATAAL